MNKPFEIFPEYLENLKSFITSIGGLDEEEILELINLFEELSYKDIIDFKFGRKIFCQL